MHAGLRCRWCGLPLACSTACATTCSTACSTALACLSCVAPWASARPSEGTWRVGVSDGVQSRTPYARLRSLETSTAHASSPVTPRRVQASRAAEPSVKAASCAPSPGRAPRMLGGHMAAEPSRVIHLSTHRALLLAEHSFLAVGRELTCVTFMLENAFSSQELATLQTRRVFDRRRHRLPDSKQLYFANDSLCATA